MKPLIRTSLAALSCSIFIGSFSKSISADSYCNSANKPYLFVISASKANFEKNNGQNTLLLKGLSKLISRVDRTTYTSSTVSTGQFVKLWGRRVPSEGSEANAILNYQLQPQNTSGQVGLTLSQPQYDSAKNFLQFHFYPMKGLEKIFTQLSEDLKNKNSKIGGYISLSVVGCFPLPQQ